MGSFVGLFGQHLVFGDIHSFGTARCVQARACVSMGARQPVVLLTSSVLAQGRGAYTSCQTTPHMTLHTSPYRGYASASWKVPICKGLNPMATNTNQTWKRVTLFFRHGPPQHQAAGELSRLQHGLNLPPPPPPHPSVYIMHHLSFLSVHDSVVSCFCYGRPGAATE